MSSKLETARKLTGRGPRSSKEKNNKIELADMAGNVAAEDQSECKFMVVAAIDFGTTFTGYAFSSKDNYKTIKISSFKWNRTQLAKAPTKALFDRDQKFTAFGYAAEDKFRELVEDDEDKDWYYFERFKMSLYHSKNLKRDAKLTDKNGKEMRALDVFSAVINHLKTSFEELQKMAKAGFQPDDVLWVLTVPAIWSDSAKQFMREAATMAGIDNDHLKIVLEPEAASLFCKSEQFTRTTKLDDSVVYDPFPAGHRFIIADLGGGTVDLAVHEILEDGNLKEVRRSNGGAYGGTHVDKNFLELLDDMFGKDIMTTLKVDCIEKYIELEEEFEKGKQTFSLKPEDNIRIKYPAAAIDALLCKHQKGSIDDIKKSIKEKYADEIILKKDKIQMTGRKMFELFDSALQGIIEIIEELRASQNETPVDTLVLVGGLSDSIYIKTELEKRMRSQGVRTFVPYDAYLAVLKGAVLMGHKPKTITERIARYTYGFSLCAPFEEGVHPENLKIQRNGKYMCNAVFKKCITIGETLKPGDYFPIKSSHISRNIFDRIGCLFTELYKSTKQDPKVCTEEDCERVGTIIQFPPPGGWPTVSLFLDILVMGETELTVLALESNGRIRAGKTDFL